jgi:hypothetical protein
MQLLVKHGICRKQAEGKNQDGTASRQKLAKKINPWKLAHAAHERTHLLQNSLIVK